jgi:tetratricopeptide (TPR) repeat protein
VFRNDPDWKRVEAMMWLSRDKPDKAESSIKQGIQMVQGQVDRALPLIQDYLGILARQKKFRDLQGECNELLKRPELAKLYWVYQMRGVGFAGMDGHRAEALTDFDKALAITSTENNQDGMAIVIQTVADSIGIDEAIARCEREAAKGDNHWLVIKAFLYFTKHDYPKAEAAIEQVLAQVDSLKTETERQTAYGVAGSIYMLTGEYVKAQIAYSTLLKMKPEDTVSLNNLACVWSDYMDPPDPAKALTYSAKAIEIVQRGGLQPDPNLLDTHGWALVCNNRLDEGIGFIQDAIDRSPRKPMPEAFYHLGQALLKKNLGPEAQAQLERAKKLLDDRKNKGQQTDVKMEARLIEALGKARQLNGITDPVPTAPTTAPAASGGGGAGTSASVKP